MLHESLFCKNKTHQNAQQAKTHISDTQFHKAELGNLTLTLFSSYIRLFNYQCSTSQLSVAVHDRNCVFVYMCQLQECQTKHSSLWLFELMQLKVSRTSSTFNTSTKSVMMSRNKVIYQTVCSLEASQFVGLIEGNLKLKEILTTVLNRSGCGVIEADGGVLMVGLQN